MRQLHGESLDETVFVDIAAPDMAVKIAIGAFRQTKRPMDVNAEAGVESAANRC
jgi:hypothetical protein